MNNNQIDKKDAQYQPAKMYFMQWQVAKQFEYQLWDLKYEQRLHIHQTQRLPWNNNLKMIPYRRI